MKSNTKRILSKAVLVVSLFCMTVQPSVAALLNLTQSPLFAGSNIPPKVMLTISKDQQLYKKAYNDYSDLDGDGIIETTYKHSIDYYGYFDPTKCYRYDTSKQRFDPVGVSILVNGKPNKKCNNDWSGNFLNWVTMSRMDAVRKLLYGGMRSTDETFAAKGVNAETVLERAYLPTDAHAWAKYYNPPNGIATADQPAINELTPFTVPTIATPWAAISTFTVPTTTGDYTMNFTGSQQPRVELGDQLKIAVASNPAQFFRAAVLDIQNSGQRLILRINTAGIFGGAAGVTSAAWLVSNPTEVGVSFCNLTKGAATGIDQFSQTNTQPPTLRVAQGNNTLWNANERWQCQWFEERNNFQAGFPGGLRSNGNQAALSGMDASAENPSQNSDRAGGANTLEYNVRVQACKRGLEGTEKCKVYPNGTLKPIGLLQEYGDRQRIHFGLMTGSYVKNVSGGVLRKNIGDNTADINVDTDGTFKEPYRPVGYSVAPGRTTSSTATPAGIVNTLNYMRIYGYNYGDGSYLGATGDNCTYQLTNIVENQCTSWGNPMSEIFLEAIRYFASPKTAGVPTPTSAYAYLNTDATKDRQLGLPIATWTDPLDQSKYCAPLAALVFNSSVSTNDDDARTVQATAINGGSSTLAALTNRVGDIEGITGGSYFIGKMLGATPTAPGSVPFELCTPKTVSALGDVSGICPEGPTTAGTYLMAGVAHHAHTNRIRTDLTVPATDELSLKVNTYGIQLATNVPTLTIPIPNTTRRVILQPIYRLDLGTTFGGGALVDMKIINFDAAAGTGKVYVNWEDSEQGGDYDQDMWGTIDWKITGGTIQITTNAISASTANPQGFGYSLSGTDKDGAHFHSGIYGFNYSDPQGVLGCTNCNVTGGAGQTGAQSVTYNITGAIGNALQDPLWYAAKYGGFLDTNSDTRPDTVAEWDRQKIDGTPGADGIPDNYFLVTNPLGLEVALSKALQKIIVDASGSAVAANSTSMSTLTALYQAKFNTGDWSGQLLAYQVDPTTGVLNSTPKWDAGATLTNATDTPPASRYILTFNDAIGVRDGTLFDWAPATTCSLTFCTELNKNPDTNSIDGRGQLRVSYLRGDRSLETGGSAVFRQRASVLGDIVDSSPTYVGAPSATVLDSSYAAFRNTHKNRKPMVYVGANDGMLHGFEAGVGTGDKGVERIAYVPSKVFTNLNDLTSVNFVHKYYVNATPEIQDAFFKTSEDPTDRWRTALVSGLGGGGQGLFALDVTNPDGGGNAPAFTNTNAAKVVLWEFNESDDKSLGYTFGKPLIRKMKNGRWAAIVSGGYNNSDGDPTSASTTGKANLFIIFLDGPTGTSGSTTRVWRRITSGNDGDYIRIPMGTVGTASTPNALAQPFAADVTGDGSVDYIYAGDLFGNFWKVDVTSATSANWMSTSNQVVLFQAKDPVNGAPQPITTAAEGTTHPTGVGYILTFGTGKYLEFSDTVGPFQKQSFYGIWDKNDPPSGSGISSQTKVTSRSQLLVQTMSEVTSGSDLLRVITDNAPAWNPPSPAAPHMGWVIDFLRADGERVIVSPIILAARLIFATNVPSGNICSGGGVGYLMVVNPTTGGRVASAVLDTNNDRTLSAADKIDFGGVQVYVSGLRMDTGASGTPAVVRPGIGGNITAAGPSAGGMAGQGSAQASAFTGTQSGTIITMPIGVGKDLGRVTWREILTR